MLHFLRNNLFLKGVQGSSERKIRFKKVQVPQTDIHMVEAITLDIHPETQEFY